MFLAVKLLIFIFVSLPYVGIRANEIGHHHHKHGHSSHNHHKTSFTSHKHGIHHYKGNSSVYTPKDWMDVYHDHQSTMTFILDDGTVETEMRPYRDFVTSDRQNNHPEAVLAIEHFFWGLHRGIALEVGARDGSNLTSSASSALESKFRWRRVLVEGNWNYRTRLVTNSPQAYSVNAVICSRHHPVHYLSSNVSHELTSNTTPSVNKINYIASKDCSGIAEFMSPHSLHQYHRDIYFAGTPHGNVSNLPWNRFHSSEIRTVECVPLHLILHWSGITHVNWFFLDVEGAELDVLKSINWKSVKFDVITTAVHPEFRPHAYASKVATFLHTKGYNNITGIIDGYMRFSRLDYMLFKKPGHVPLSQTH